MRPVNKHCEIRPNSRTRVEGKGEKWAKPWLITGDFDIYNMDLNGTSIKVAAVSLAV